MNIPIALQVQVLDEAKAAIDAVIAFREERSRKDGDREEGSDLSRAILTALQMYPPLSDTKRVVLETLVHSLGADWVPFSEMVEAVDNRVSQVGQKASDLATAVLRDLSYQLKEKVPSKYLAGLRSPIEVLASRSRTAAGIRYKLTPAGLTAVRTLLA